MAENVYVQGRIDVRVQAGPYDRYKGVIKWCIVARKNCKKGGGGKARGDKVVLWGWGRGHRVTRTWDRIKPENS